MTTVTWMRCATLAALLAAVVSAHAREAVTHAPVANDKVLTQATVQSRFEHEGGARLYVRLKLQSIRHAPFSTLTYRVPDRATWEGLQPRAKVAFSAARIDGENTLTAVRVLPH